ncbi:hypothetical protein K491DRAFT_685550 [Lophiostoma macrostomum CBS 122681]|uniref:Uncharacterized protein n=1 Tax=Lophiostoma macrostomum CBS 122681 TaxID=1314788 RepID=A0A6A6SHS3_9PLEO|nr:hypothetical protein K491DRAFT_685550 [Lophiostoma macrostomum CBS 122681]
MLSLLFAAPSYGTPFLRRDDPSPEVTKALVDAGVDVGKQVATPKNVAPPKNLARVYGEVVVMKDPLTTVQKVDQVLAIGDSYTAGIGANGYPDSWGWNNCSRYYGAWPVLLSNKNEWKDFGSASIANI